MSGGTFHDPYIENLLFNLGGQCQGYTKVNIHNLAQLLYKIETIFVWALHGN